MGTVAPIQKYQIVILIACFAVISMNTCVLLAMSFLTSRQGQNRNG
jgi:hypothetical protein